MKAERVIAWAFLVTTIFSVSAPAWAQPHLPGEQARIDRAIKDYQLKQDAGAAAARDQRAAGKIDALDNDPGSPSMGNPKGDVTIVEFFDYVCPYCKAVEPRLEAVLKSDRRVKLVLKEFPILTQQSMIASRMALAAVRQGKYTPFHLALMHATGSLQAADIDAIAQSVGLNVGKLHKDMYAPEVTDEIIANFNLARAMRAFQTPTFVVGSHILAEDSADIDFSKAVSAARTK
jgi:protein-disulfide isomerase